MMKASVMFSTHTTHVLFRNTLICLIIFFIALFLWLQHGIEVDRLIIDDCKVKKLYLKLDKKFTLKVTNLTLIMCKEFFFNNGRVRCKVLIAVQYNRYYVLIV